MLDKFCKKLLNVLINMCNSGSYSILEIDEILSLVNLKMDFELFKKYIDYLANNQYIDVKYVDDKQICLAVLPKAKGIDEEVKLKKQKTKKQLFLMFVVGLISAIFGFLGAIFGSYIFWVWV